MLLLKRSHSSGPCACPWHVLHRVTSNFVPQRQRHDEVCLALIDLSSLFLKFNEISFRYGTVWYNTYKMLVYLKFVFFLFPFPFVCLWIVFLSSFISVETLPIQFVVLQFEQKTRTKHLQRHINNKAQIPAVLKGFYKC